MRIWTFFLSAKLFAAFNLTWGIPPVSLDSNPPIGDTDVHASIALDSLGNAAATWGRTASSHAVQDIWASFYVHSSRVWTGAIPISGGSDAAHPQAVMDPFGNATFIWEEGFPTQIYFRTLSANGVWSPSTTLAPLKVNPSLFSQVQPHIQIDSQGNALAVWVELYDGVSHIHSARKAFQKDWVSLGEIALGAFPETQVLSMNPSGDAMVVWQRSGHIYASRYEKGAWQKEEAISEGDSLAQFPTVALDEEGNGIVVWTQDQKIQAKRWGKNGLSSVLPVSFPEYAARHPNVKIDGKGNALVVFERYNSLHKFIAGASLPYGEHAWSNPRDISPPSPAGAKGAGYPVLALNSMGDGVVVWKECDGENLLIQGAGYSLGSWSFVKTLSEIGSGIEKLFPCYDIDVAINKAGHVMAVWPEDSVGNGSRQMKASLGVGLANLSPQPPTPDPITIENGVAYGYQTIHRFPAHADYINVLHWETATPAVYYRIYRGNFHTLIGTSQVACYEDHQRDPGKKETYLITCVDVNEQESAPMTLVVYPK